jgi:hypothetical protein
LPWQHNKTNTNFELESPTSPWTIGPQSQTIHVNVCEYMSLWFVVCLFDHVSYHDWWHNHSFMESLSVPDPTNLYLVLLVLAWVPQATFI